MQDTCGLLIGLHRAGGVPRGVRGCNRIWGGPTALLRWLETALGLGAATQPSSLRVSQYAHRLDGAADPEFADSLAVDRWSTATVLLARRDALHLAGWSGQPDAALPAMAAALARVEAAAGPLADGDAERLRSVLTALDAGQVLPPHRCELEQPVEEWPPAWQQVLARLDIQSAPTPNAAAGDTALGAIQRSLATGQPAPVSRDSSLTWCSAQSRVVAADALATLLAADTDLLPTTVILCEDPATAVLVDSALAFRGLPTCGASLTSGAHPLRQLLPLALSLSWEPVDPEALLNFLSLPTSPVPPKVGRHLSHALAEQPGLGSQAFEDAVAALTAPSEDPKGRNKARIEAWLSGPRVPRGEPLPATVVRQRAAALAQWAAGYASFIESDDQRMDRDTLVQALRSCAGQAAALAELVESEGSDIGEMQLLRLLDAASGAGAEVQPHAAAAGGPTWVRSLVDVPQGCERLVWLALSTDTRGDRAWSEGELAALNAAGIAMNDGAVALRSLRRVEREGLMSVRTALLLVSVPADAEAQPHPLWSRIRACLAAGEGASPSPVSLEAVITSPSDDALLPWRVTGCDVAVQSRQPARPAWTLPRGLLNDRTRSSASELETRLACPLKWVFNYVARLDSSPIANLPGGLQLKGSFCHDVLERALGGGGPLPPADEAVARVATVFDQRLPLDAAPLAQPAQKAECDAVRVQLLQATRALIAALSAGGYHIVSLEHPVDGVLNPRSTVDRRALTGSIDCLVEDDAGGEAVIDFKYGGRSKYPKLLKEGRATQLAVYAHGRATEVGKDVGDIPVAYLILADGLLITPEGSPVRGATDAQIERGAPGIADTWASFSAALRSSQRWLSGDEPIPARPLQDPNEWPAGAEISLEGERGRLGKEKDFAVCKYCSYPALCGRKEVD